MKQIIILFVLILCIGLVFFFVPFADEWIQMPHLVSGIGK